MADTKKKRTSMLDNLATAGALSAPASMISSNRALRSARDAVDAHRVWELEPNEIEDGRVADRLGPEDVHDLRASIEQNGQTVPILVRRHPSESGRYLLVYGYRRLEAIRGSDRVNKVRALIAHLDDSAALRAQVSENTGRRDLSYIERALFALELLDNGFGTQAQVAEVLNVTRSAVSMSISVAKAIGRDLAQAIGPAHGVGRPRWEALSKEISETRSDIDQLCRVALGARNEVTAREQSNNNDEFTADPSVVAFEAVSRHLRKSIIRARASKPRSKSTVLVIDGVRAGAIKKSTRGIRLDLTNVDGAFAAWLESQAQDVLQDLHARWKRET